MKRVNKTKKPLKSKKRKSKICTSLADRSEKGYFSIFAVVNKSLNNSPFYKRNKNFLFNAFLLISLFLLFWIISTNFTISQVKNDLTIKDNTNSKKQQVVVTKENDERKNISKKSELVNNSDDKISQITPTFESGFCLYVPVLMYHHVEPLEQARKEGHAGLTVDSDVFDQQMQYLVNNNYITLSAEDLPNALIKHEALPGKPIVITLDDGYSDIYEYAYPIAKKYNVVLNLMIPTGLMNNKEYMSWDNLKEMVNSGIVNAYDHTWSHYSLPIGDDAKDEMEIMTAKNQLEENLGKEVKIFAYPYGSSNQRVRNILMRNGFVAAYSTIPSSYQCETSIYELKRTRIGNSPLSSYGF